MSPRFVVTGARGKVGSRIVAALTAAGHEVLATDMGRPEYDTPVPGSARYVQADLTVSGDAFDVLTGAEIVIHAAAIPEPSKNTAATVFGVNTTMSWNVIDAAARLGVRRVINISSDSVAGMTWAHRPFVAETCPIDESLPDRPQDAYGLSKQVSEQLCDAFVRRTGGTAVSIRPTWVQTPGSYERNLGPIVRDPAILTAVFWSYIDVDDVADLVVLAALSDSPGHEVIYAAAEDNIGSRDLHAAVTAAYPSTTIGGLARPDASGISSAKAARMFGWRATRSWRDYLDSSGRSLPVRH